MSKLILLASVSGPEHKTMDELSLELLKIPHHKNLPPFLLDQVQEYRAGRGKECT